MGALLVRMVGWDEAAQPVQHWGHWLHGTIQAAQLVTTAIAFQAAPYAIHGRAGSPLPGRWCVAHTGRLQCFILTVKLPAALSSILYACALQYRMPSGMRGNKGTVYEGGLARLACNRARGSQGSTLRAKLA